MSEEDIRKEVAELREMIVKLEVKVDDLTNRAESLAKTQKSIPVTCKNKQPDINHSSPPM